MNDTPMRIEARFDAGLLDDLRRDNEALRRELRDLLGCFWEGRPKRDVRRDYHLMVQCEAARSLLAKLEA